MTESWDEFLQRRPTLRPLPDTGDGLISSVSYVRDGEAVTSRGLPLGSRMDMTIQCGAHLPQFVTFVSDEIVVSMPLGHGPVEDR